MPQKQHPRIRRRARPKLRDRTVRIEGGEKPPLKLRHADAPEPAIVSPNNKLKEEPSTARSGRKPARAEPKEDETMVVRRAKPPPPIFHEISDDQLQMFLDCNRDGLSDVMSAALGLGTGLLIPSGEAVYASVWGNPAVPMGWLHIIELIGTFVAFAVGITIAFVSRRRSSRSEILAAKLRALHANGG